MTRLEETMEGNLPDDLAPKLREEAERLIAEVGEAQWDGKPPRRGREQVKCYRCGKGSGRMTFHHLDDGTAVYIHPRCHRKIHGQAGGKSRKRRK